MYIPLLLKRRDKLSVANILYENKLTNDNDRVAPKNEGSPYTI